MDPTHSATPKGEESSTISQRAYQLASSGKYKNLRAIEEALRKEGYKNVENAFNNAIINSRLRLLCRGHIGRQQSDIHGICAKNDAVIKSLDQPLVRDRPIDKLLRLQAEGIHALLASIPR